MLENPWKSCAFLEEALKNQKKQPENAGENPENVTRLAWENMGIQLWQSDKYKLLRGKLGDYLRKSGESQDSVGKVLEKP